MSIEQAIDNLKLSDFVCEIRTAGTPLDDVDRDFLDGYYKADNTALPEKYAVSGDRILLLDKISKKFAFGGVLLVRDRAEFRTGKLAPLPEYPENSFEMNGLWLFRACLPPDRLSFWAVVCKHLMSLGSGFVFFSYDLKKKGLDSFYQSLGGDTIYHGPVRGIEGMSGDSEEAVIRLDLDTLSQNINNLFSKKERKTFRG